MTAPYILARTPSEARKFAEDELGLGRGYFRIVTSPSSIKGPYGADLYILPGWEGRFDRFAMRGALKWTRLKKIDVAEWRQLQQAEEPDVLLPGGGQVGGDGVVDDLQPPGEQLSLVSDEEADLLVRNEATTLTPEDIAELESLLEPEGFELSDDPEVQAKQILESAAAEAEEPKRRRRRCPECGVLVDPDDLEQHKSEHLPQEV